MKCIFDRSHLHGDAFCVTHYAAAWTAMDVAYGNGRGNFTALRLPTTHGTLDMKAEATPVTAAVAAGALANLADAKRHDDIQQING